MASVSGWSIYQNRAFWLFSERLETNSTDRSGLAEQSLTSFSLYILKISVLWNGFKVWCACEWGESKCFLLSGRRETNTKEIRDVTMNCFCFCNIINSLLTELVRSVQEDTAGLVLFSFVCGHRLRLGPKKQKKNRLCSIFLYGPLAQSITYVSYN